MVLEFSATQEGIYACYSQAHTSHGSYANPRYASVSQVLSLWLHGRIAKTSSIITMLAHPLIQDLDEELM